MFPVGATRMLALVGSAYPAYVLSQTWRPGGSPLLVLYPVAVTMRPALTG
jgi:hypothetical protein